MKKWIQFVLLFITLFSFTSCLTSKRLDKFVAEQYNNELPKPDKKKKADIIVNSSYPTNNSAISTTVRKTDKFLPLIVYWHYKHRKICSLNTTIPVTKFSNTINSLAARGLNQKLNGQRLELIVEQAPSAFSIVADEHIVWVIYAFSWAKIYIEPDFKNLVVSYKLMQDDKALKTGKISVKNSDKNQGIRFFQSWKSATSEYLSNYDANVTAMTKSFINQIIQEL